MRRRQLPIYVGLPQEALDIDAFGDSSMSVLGGKQHEGTWWLRDDIPNSGARPPQTDVDDRSCQSWPPLSAALRAGPADGVDGRLRDIVVGLLVKLPALLAPALLMRLESGGPRAARLDVARHLDALDRLEENRQRRGWPASASG